ncbi:MAG: LysE family transporter [Acidimicrobiia bacterium]
MGTLLTGMLAGYGIAIPVGAIAILIVQTGLRSGFAMAFSAGAGAATADLLYASLAVVGGTALTEAIGRVGRPLRLASGIVLIAVAVNGLWQVRARPKVGAMARDPVPDRRSRWGLYGRFLLLTMVNPTTVVYFAAVIVGLGVTESLTGGEGALFAIGAFLASLSWQTALAAIGGLVGQRLSYRVEQVAVIVGNLVILGLATAIVLG